jgi:hypothetical protein
MAGGARKHGAHRENLWISVPTANVVPGSAIYVYDPFAELGGGSGASSTAIGYDLYQEAVIEMALTLDTALTGQATNFTTFAVTHRNAAATTKNAFTIVASTTAFIFAAFVPANLGVASGATIPGGGTGTLTIGTGTALPWKLVPGDTIALSVAVTGTGQYTLGVGLGFVVAGLGA